MRIAWLFLMAVAGCAPAGESLRQAEPRPDQMAEQVQVQVGPRIAIARSPMAEILHFAEGLSLWRTDIPRAMQRAFDDKFGLDEIDRELLKRFAFIRQGLRERERKDQPAPSCDQPFGPEGLFPGLEPRLQARFWQTVSSAPEPGALTRSLAGLVEPTDAKPLAECLAKLAERVGKITLEQGLFQAQTKELDQKLRKAGALLSSLALLAGAEPTGVEFRVHPVWLPKGQPAEAQAYGDTIVLGLPDGQVGPAEIAEVVRAMTGRLLARLPLPDKALFTARFVERAGFRAEPFALVEGLSDAAGYGLAAPLVAAGPATVPPWPGSAERQRAAETLTALLRQWLDQKKRLDGSLVLEAAAAVLSRNPARPSDYVDGAMVIANEAALQPFKEKVTRWVVCKYPLGGKYNYPRKLEENPGRSVLMILTPKDLQDLPARFPANKALQQLFEQALTVLRSKRGVIAALARESRGYIFVTAASGPKAMSDVARAFFALESIPESMVEVP